MTGNGVQSEFYTLLTATQKSLTNCLANGDKKNDGRNFSVTRNRRFGWLTYI